MAPFYTDAAHGGRFRRGVTARLNRFRRMFQHDTDKSIHEAVGQSSQTQLAERLTFQVYVSLP